MNVYYSTDYPIYRKANLVNQDHIATTDSGLGQHRFENTMRGLGTEPWLTQE